MAETRTLRFKDPDDGKTYDVTLTEATRVEISSAGTSVTTIKTKITDEVNNNYSAGDAETIALLAVERIAGEGLLT